MSSERNQRAKGERVRIVKSSPYSPKPQGRTTAPDLSRVVPGRGSRGAGSAFPVDFANRPSRSPPPRQRSRDLLRRTDSPAGTGGAAAPLAPGAAAQAAGPAREPVSLPAFLRGRRGSVSVETAIATALLVTAFAGIMQIFHSAYVSDRMDRAARSAARAIAFTPGADASSLPGLACQAIRKELDLGEGFDCATRISVEIENSLAPAGLSGTEGSEDAAPAGHLVRIRIAWSDGKWNPGTLVSGDDPDSRRVAVGIARLEPIEGA